jgi:hypothetical protein
MISSQFIVVMKIIFEYSTYIELVLIVLVSSLLFSSII